ncbi:uncharacterized protein PAE49_001045 isoform 2-T2 [Odontesthes bonariensis]|uniref:uncharacterized protein LOC142373569 isoform X2 n=1 Tax=Odontesthes bonariensis TaxID=219752 RepID=UPI003F58570B
MENLKRKNGSGTTCAVVGCTNSRKHLNEWLDRECFDHKPATKRQCPCPPLFTFFRKPDTDSESRAWLKALDLKKPPRNVFVCSHHFADKRPTEDNPFPELWLGCNRFTRPKRRQLTERTAASPQIKKRRLQSEVSDSRYIRELQIRILKRRIACGAGMPQRWSLQPDDPRGPSLVPPVPAASTSELEQTQDSKDLNVQQLFVIKEEVPWSSSVDQQDPEPVHIKEEEEELWSRREGEQLHGQEESDISRFSVTAVTVKSEEEDEEKPQFSQLLQIKSEDNRETEPPTSSSAELMKTEADRGKEPYPNSGLLPDTDEQEFCETEASDTERKQTMVPESGRNHDGGCNTARKSFSCSECSKQFLFKKSLKTHMRVHTGEKPFGCDVCGKRFNQNAILKTHMRVHTGEKPFSCDFCAKRFNQVSNLKVHIRVHTMEKPYTCDDCGKKFKTKTHLKSHMGLHTGEKPFGCDACGKQFKTKTDLKSHMRVHTGTPSRAHDGEASYLR